MGVSESSIKSLTESATHLIDSCGHSGSKSKFGNCSEIEIDTTQSNNSLPGRSTLQATYNSRDSATSITSSSLTKV
jgi:hypothetical protein